MANRYWVGGSGTWDSTNTANWSTTSGGAGGASVPSINDVAIFNANSHGGAASVTITISSPLSISALSISSLAVPFTFPGTGFLGINNNSSGSGVTLPTSNFSSSGTWTINLSNGVFRSNGSTIGNPVDFGQSCSIADNLTSTSSVTVSGGLSLSTFNLTCDTFSLTNNGISAGSGAYIAVTGNSKIVWSCSVTGSTTPFDVKLTGTPTTGTRTIAVTGTLNGSINFYVTGGSDTVTLSGSGRCRILDFTGFSGTFALSNLTLSFFSSLLFSATTTVTSTVGTGTLTSAATSGTSTLTTNGIQMPNISINGAGGTLQLVDNLTMVTGTTLSLIAGTLDINSKTTVIRALSISTTGVKAITNGTLSCTSVSHASGTIAIGTGYNITSSGTYTFTTGTITINDGVTLSVGAFASTGTGTRSIAFGTGNITTTGTGTVWNMAAVTGFSYTGSGTVNISNGTATAATITNTAGAASALNFNITTGTYALTLTSGGSYNNLNFTGFAGTASLGTNTYTIYGNLNLGSTATITATAGTNTFSWISTSGTRTITSNGRTANFGISLNGVGQTLQLADAFVQGSTQSFAYTNGTFDMAGYSTSLGVVTITTGTHAISNGTLNCANVTHTSGDLSVGTGYLLVCSGTYTFTAGTITLNNGVALSVGNFSSSNSNTRSVAFGSLGSFIEVTGSGATAWNLATPTNFGYTGTPLVKLTYSGSIATTISSALTAISFSITAGTYLLTIATGTIIQNLDFTGFSGTYSQGATTCSVLGNIIFASSMSSTTTSGSISMTATSGTRTITSNGDTIGCSINFNGVGGTFQLADNFSQTSTASFIITNGTVDFNNVTYTLGILTFVSGTKSYINYGGNLSGASIVHTSGPVTLDTGALVSTTGSYTFTAGTITINNGVTLSVGSFSSSNSNIRSIAFGTGAINLTGTGTVWNTGTLTNFSYTGTSNVRLTNSGSTATTITAGAATAAQSQNFFVTAGTYALTISSGSIINNLDFTGFSGSFTLGGTVSLRGNLVLSSTTTSTSVAQSLSFIGSSVTQTVTTAGVTIGCSISIAGTTNIVRLLDSLTQNTARALNLTTGTLDINSQTTSVGILTITTGTHAITNGTLNCASVTHTSGDLSIGSGYLVVSTGAYTFTAGSITVNNDVSLIVGSFTSTNTNTRTIALGVSGDITTTGTGTVWNVTGVTGLTVTGSGGVYIDNNTSTGVTITNTATSSNALSFVFINGTYPLTLTSGNTYYGLFFQDGFAGSISFGTSTHTLWGSLRLSPSMTTSATAGTNTLSWTATSGTRTITSNGCTANFGISLNGVGQTLQLADALIQGSTQRFSYTNGTFDMAGYSTSVGIFTITTGTHAIANGTLTCASVTHTSGNLTTGSGYLVVSNGTYTLTNGTITINDNVTLKVFAFSSNNSNAGRSIAFGASGLVEITGKSTTVWLVNPAGFTYTGTSLVRLTATGTGTTTTINPGTGSATISFNFEVTAGSYPISTPLGAGFKSLNFTGYSGTWTNVTGANLYGDLIISSGMSFGSTFGTITFNTGTYNAVLTSNGKNFLSSVAFSNTGSITLTDNFSSSSSVTRNSGGTLTANGDVTAATITLNGDTNLGSGAWNVTSSGSAWNTGAAVTITPGTSTIKMASPATKTFAGAGKTYYNLEQNDTGTLIITGSNSFNDITVTPSLAASTITLTSGTTQTVTNFTLSGSAGNLVTLNSSTPGSPATLSKSTGTVSVSYVNIVDSTATGGATWQAYTSNGNVDGGGNSGWDFGALVAAAIGAFFAFF